MNNTTEHPQADPDKNRLYYDILMDYSRDIILFIQFEDGRILEANKAAEAAYGYSREQLLKMNIYDLRATPDNSAVTSQMAEANGKSILFNAFHRRADGSTFPVEVSSQGTDFGKKRVLVSIIRDITRRRIEEEQRDRLLAELQQSRTILHRAEEVSHTGAWQWDIAKNRWEFSDEWMKIHGVNNLRLSEDDLLNIAHPEDRDLVKQEVEHVKQGIKPYDIEHRIIRQDTGEVRIITANGYFVRNTAGAVEKVYGFTQDITERKQAEEALRQSEQRFRDAFTHMPLGMVILDLEGRFLHVNEAYCRITGYTKEELLQPDFTFQRLTHPDDLEKNLIEMDRMLAGEIPAFFLEKRYLRKDGTAVWVRTNTSLRRDAAGRPTQILGLLEDISDRKNAEEALRRLNNTLEQRIAERTRLAENQARQLRTLVSELALSEQRERSRLAEFLHDNLQQLLVAAKMNSEMLSAQIETAHKQTTENIIDLLTQSIQMSRTLTAELSPPALRQGRLSDALEWLARWMHENYGLEVDLHIESGLDPKREDMAVLIFQSIRELLFNVIKHSGVKSAHLDMACCEENKIRISVIDWGHGFDTRDMWEKEQEGSGFGLLSIRERLSVLGGDLEIESAPGKGAVFSLWVPLELTKTMPS
ncbi:MAG: PAS domain S-box protein [Desulfobacterales bacterium]